MGLTLVIAGAIAAVAAAGIPRVPTPPGWQPLQASACVAHPDTAGYVMTAAKSVLFDSDSTELAFQGLPFAPASVTVIAEEPTCASKHLPRAYVLRVGTAVFAVVGDGRSVYSFFDASGRGLGAILH
jgi:hypothetical protein